MIREEWTYCCCMKLAQHSKTGRQWNAQGRLCRSSAWRSRSSPTLAHTALHKPTHVYEICKQMSTHTQTITPLQRNTLLHRLAYSVMRTGSRTALSLNSAKQKTVENTKQWVATDWHLCGQLLCNLSSSSFPTMGANTTAKHLRQPVITGTKHCI